MRTYNGILQVSKGKPETKNLLYLVGEENAKAYFSEVVKGLREEKTMKFKVRNWMVDVEKRTDSCGEEYYTGWLDFEGKSGYCGTGWTGNGVTVRQDGRIFYDWPETVPNYLKEALLNKCNF